MYIKYLEIVWNSENTKRIWFEKSTTYVRQTYDTPTIHLPHIGKHLPHTHVIPMTHPQYTIVSLLDLLVNSAIGASRNCLRMSERA